MSKIEVGYAEYKLSFHYHGIIVLHASVSSAMSLLLSVHLYQYKVMVCDQLRLHLYQLI